MPLPDARHSQSIWEALQPSSEPYERGPSTWREARSLAESIPPDDLASWLKERIANPAAERYLLALYYGEEGVTSGRSQAFHRFYREVSLRLRPRLQRKVLGWGEISQVAEVAGSPITAWRDPNTSAPMPVVYKKMPPFLSRPDAEAFVQRYMEYNTVLRDEVGIPVPHFDARIDSHPCRNAFA